MQKELRKASFKNYSRSLNHPLLHQRAQTVLFPNPFHLPTDDHQTQAVNQCVICLQCNAGQCLKHAMITTNSESAGYSPLQIVLGMSSTVPTDLAPFQLHGLFANTSRIMAINEDVQQGSGLLKHITGHHLKFSFCT